jgi:hypothetical protein
MTGTDKLYRVYLNEPWNLASVYGFRKTAEDGRKYQDRYLTDNGIEEYEGELWMLGITDVEFVEVDDAEEE